MQGSLWTSKQISKFYNNKHKAFVVAVVDYVLFHKGA